MEKGAGKKRVSKIDLVSKDVKNILRAVKRVSRDRDMELKAVDGYAENIEVEVDDETRSKITKFAINLINLKDIRVGISSNDISIEGEINGGPSKATFTTNQLPTTGRISNSRRSDYISMRITKDKGFTMNTSYTTNFYFKCESLYDDIKPLVVEKIKEVAKSELMDVMDEILLSTGLARQNNLDELIK